MRFITTASRHSHHFARIVGLVLFCFPTVVFGYTITDEDGCFERAANIMRGTEPTCVFTLTPDTVSETISLTTENIDPYSVTAEFTGDDLIVDYDDTVTITGILTQPTTITITPWYEITDDLWFVALSDNQARGTVETNPVFEDMLPIINRINPAFMTNSGDLVNGSSDEDTLSDMFSAVLESLVDTVVPMYPTPGNHDYLAGLTAYIEHFGEPDYSYDLGPARLVALSSVGSTSRGTVSDSQLEWLDNELTSTDLQTIVYFHHPLSPPSWAQTTCCFEEASEHDALAAELDNAQVDYVLNGHSQGYEFKFVTAADIDSIVDGFNQLITGSAGGHVSQPGGDYLFTLLHVTPNSIDHYVMNLSDTSLAFDETDNNGRHDHAVITSEYEGAQDLPYLRLKFDLKNYSDGSYLVSDAAGNYLPYQSHVYGDHRILLATASQTQNTTTDFTALVATTLHTGTTNTASGDGDIQFIDSPTDSTTNTHIGVTPSKLVTTITELTATRHGYKWTETPAKRSVDTTYTVEDLTDGDVIRVYLNGHLHKRLVANHGSAVFTLAKNARQRRVRIRK